MPTAPSVIAISRAVRPTIAASKIPVGKINVRLNTFTSRAILPHHPFHPPISMLTLTSPASGHSLATANVRAADPQPLPTTANAREACKTFDCSITHAPTGHQWLTQTPDVKRTIQFPAEDHPEITVPVGLFGAIHWCISRACGQPGRITIQDAFGESVEVRFEGGLRLGDG